MTEYGYMYIVSSLNVTNPKLWIILLQVTYEVKSDLKVGLGPRGENNKKLVSNPFNNTC